MHQILVFLLVFSIIFCLYLIAGTIYRFKKGKRSCPEMLPNYIFWHRLCWYVKVYLLKAITCCRYQPPTPPPSISSDLRAASAVLPQYPRGSIFMKNNRNNSESGFSFSDKNPGGFNVYGESTGKNGDYEEKGKDFYYNNKWINGGKAGKYNFYPLPENNLDNSEDEVEMSTEAINNIPFNGIRYGRDTSKYIVNTNNGISNIDGNANLSNNDNNSSNNNNNNNNDENKLTSPISSSVVPIVENTSSGNIINNDKKS